MFPKKLKIFLVLAMAFVLLPALFPKGLFAQEKGLREGWLWQILVYPPEAGWESEEGYSIKSALEYLAKGVNGLHYGVQNHDIRFLYQPRVLGEDIYELSLKRFQKWKDLAVVGALSFASDRYNQELVRVFQKAELPLLLAYGEDLPLRDVRGSALKYIFALDLYNRYRVAAYAHLAPKMLETWTGVAIFSDRLDKSLQASSIYLTKVLTEENMVPIPIWTAGSGARDVKPSLIEVGHEGGQVLVNIMGIMEALDLWRTMRTLEHPLHLWHAGPLDPMLEVRKDILGISQRWHLDHDPTLRELRSDIWFAIHERPKNMPVMARAYALGSWFLQGLKHAQAVPGDMLVQALENADFIPLGEENIRINPVAHRPVGRVITLLGSTGKEWQLLREFRIRSAAFPE